MLRRALTSLGPRLFTKSAAELSALSNTSCSHFLAQEDEQRQPMPDLPFPFRTFATSTTSISNLKDAGGPLNVTNKLSMTPNHKIQYDQYNHKRYPPGTEGRPFAYFVQTAGRFLYASSIRLVVIKLVLTLSPAADTLAVASIEVDFSNLEEGQTMTAKWRGKPVFIMHRRDSQIEAAEAVPMSDLKDPQTDKERVVDPKFLVVVGLCTHLGCVPIAGAGNYGGWFCPCHGSHYDTSGRARQGPAPTNLEVPEYKFIGDRKITIG